MFLHQKPLCLRLVHHVLARNVEKVRKLLCMERMNLNLDLRNMSDHGAPILYYAIANKDTDIVRLLVSAGCHIFTLMRDVDNQEIPVLFSALAMDMSPEMANALMPKDFPSQRAVIRRLLYKSRTILEVALEKRIPPATFEILIYRGGAELLAGRNQDNKTVRDIAQHAEQQEYVEAVDKVVREWVKDATSYPDQRQLLVLCGYDHITELFPRDSMQLAPDTVKYLEGVADYQEQIAELSRAVEAGKYERFEELRKYSSAVFRTNISWEACQKGDGQPLLHRAVLFNRPHIVKTILQNVPAGQSVDTLLDQHHRTALHYAYAMPDGDHLIRLLMNAGCSEHTLDRKGMEPLDFKMRCGSPAMEALLKHIRSKVPLEESRIWNSKIRRKKDLPKCCQGVAERKWPPVPPKQIHATGCSCQIGHVQNKNTMKGQIGHRGISWCTTL